MTKAALSASFILLSTLAAFGQQSRPATAPSESQWRALYAALDGEDWTAAADYASKYMKEFRGGDAAALARLRYIFIYAAAGKVIARRMTYDELERALKEFVGKEVASPARRVKAAGCAGALNFICPSSDAADKLVVAASNKSGTSIHVFEYIRLAEKFDPASHDGRWAEVGGVIESIELNPNKSDIWVMRLHVGRGAVTLREIKRVP